MNKILRSIPRTAKNVYVIIDVSSSVRSNYLKKANQIAKKISNRCAVTIVEADYEVKLVYPFGNRPHQKRIGQGGTSYTPAQAFAIEQGADAIVYFTDGYGDALVQCEVPTVWAIFEGNALPHTHRSYVVPYGKHVFLNWNQPNSWDKIKEKMTALFLKKRTV